MLQTEASLTYDTGHRIYFHGYCQLSSAYLFLVYSSSVYQLWIILFTTLHFLHKLEMGSQGSSACPVQAFTANFNVTLYFSGLIHKLQREWSVMNTATLIFHVPFFPNNCLKNKLFSFFTISHIHTDSILEGQPGVDPSRSSYGLPSMRS